ncbi:MAG: penicillin-insensitive murein endopeptidase [Nannocystaceae bacterium]
MPPRPALALALASALALACGGAPSTAATAAVPAAGPPPGPVDGATGGVEGPEAGANSPADAAAPAKTSAVETPLTLDEGAADPRGLGPEISTSIGSPADGSLVGGVRLPVRGPGYRYNPRKRDEARHAVVEVIQAVLAAAAAVDEALPGGEATIGELSLPEGGPISGHGSHQAGRDVDVLFYLLDAGGAPTPGHAVPIDPEGAGTDYKDLEIDTDDVPLKIDVPRTWRFVQALLEGDHAAVQRIFVVEHVRSMLLAEAKAVGAPAATIQRFEEVTCQPGFPHDDHLHIRFFCSVDDLAGGCTEMDPIYPWQVAALGAAGAKPIKARPRRKGTRPKLTTHAEARAKAGPMHPSVVEFLDRRAAWVKQPHPGRKYCK